MTALALAAVTLAVVVERTPLHARLAAGVYVGFFLNAGRSFSDNWGLVAWATWAVASGYGLQAVVDAARRLLVRKHTPLGAV